MKEYEIEIEFISGDSITIEIEAEDEESAYRLAMPTSLRIIGSNE